MKRARVSAVGRGLVAVLATGIFVGSAALAISSRTAETTYGGASASFALLELAAGAGLLVAALMLLGEQSTGRLGAAVAAASAAWLAPVWVGWEGGPPLARSAGLVLAPLLPVTILAAVALVPPARRLLLGLVALIAVTAAAAAVALVLVRDPLRDLYCWSDCTLAPLRRSDDVALTHRLARLVLDLGAAAGVAAAVLAAGRIARAGRAARPAFAAAVPAGIALAAYALALLAEPREEPGRPLYGWLFAARAVALVGFGAALVWLALRPRLVRARVSGLAVDLERSADAGGLGRRLADAVGDPGLRLGYPVGVDGRIVDADGQPLRFDPARRVTPLVGDGGVAALLESDVASVEALERELGPAAQLALGNERLRAEALARLADVTASRTRIVETADMARRRMERDLHDGAQQRLLALTYDLRVALTIAESSGDERAAEQLSSALDRGVTAAQELRDLAHGIFPAELASSGLEAALESLADLHPLRLTVDLRARRRFPAEIEAAAYAVVAESCEEGQPDVTVAERDGALRVTVAGGTGAGAHLEDRVGAARGTLQRSATQLEATFPLHD